MLLILLLVFWQIPHFFLVLLKHQADYTHSVSPSILRYLSEHALQRIFLPWVTAFATIMIIISFSPPAMHLGSKLLIATNCLVLLSIFYYEVFRQGKPHYNFLFQVLNGSLLLFMVTVSFEVVQ